MAMEGDDINSVNTRLTKNQAPGKLTENDSMSEITGETRESKVKAYAARETKKSLLTIYRHDCSIKWQPPE